MILDKVIGSEAVARIRKAIKSHNIPAADALELFEVIEGEVLNLHEGNIARYKVKPSEYQAWKVLQG